MGEPDHVFYQMSDSNVSIEASDFTGPNSFNLDNADDAKFGADAYSSSTGQDEEVMVQFGQMMVVVRSWMVPCSRW